VKRPSRRPVEDDWAAGSRFCVPFSYRSPKSLPLTGWPQSAQREAMHGYPTHFKKAASSHSFCQPFLRLFARPTNSLMIATQPGLGVPSSPLRGACSPAARRSQSFLSHYPSLLDVAAPPLLPTSRIALSEGSEN
jgi:hypothetical protein